jgi:secondary thiamine-phosphate synthase enzyme
MITLDIHSKNHSEMIDITSRVKQAIQKMDMDSGTCTVFVPHTTAGVTINENADPDVQTDMLNILDRVVPWEGNYRHSEGNSAAHVKASMMGNSSTLLVEEGRLVLGTWQGIYFCEFDGPRHRKVHIQLLPGL